MTEMSQLVSESLSKLQNGELRLETATCLLMAAIGVVTVVIYLKKSRATKTSPPHTNGSATTNNNVTEPSVAASNSQSAMKCVWEERRQKGILPPATVASKTETKGGKPFGSKYYYAHNNSNAKGGYSDGLRIEDFTMNGPRLLSKGGVPALAEQSADEVDESTPAQPQEPSNAANQPPTSKPPAPANAQNVRDITRYLWDDPGDSTGVATIRIETLPGKTSTETIAWKDAKVKYVTAELEGEGMKVLVTGEDDQFYRLKISRLYDKASEVRAITKQKRLLVKIHKKRTLNFWDKSNLTPWPHPQKKI